MLKKMFTADSVFFDNQREGPFFFFQQLPAHIFNNFINMLSE